METQNPAFIQIGTLGRKKGLKGEIKLHLLPQRLVIRSSPRVVYLSERGQYVPYPLILYKTGPTETLLQFLGISSPEQTQSLVGKSVFLPADELEEPGFSYSDLAGFTASDLKAGLLGEIQRVDIYPQQLIASIFYKANEILVPLNEYTVHALDEEGGTVMLDLPEGLLEVFVTGF